VGGAPGGMGDMSTTGHYTRYINQYPGWSDNCDSMYRELYIPGMHHDCKICDYPCRPETTEEKRIDLCPVKLGYLTIEHTYGNKRAFLTFTYDNQDYNYWDWIKEQTNYIGPLKPGNRFTLIDYTGKLAIQHVIKESYKVKESDMIDRIFKDQFYNRSHSDYFRYYLHRVDINV
jgi:hypothetical protein